MKKIYLLVLACLIVAGVDAQKRNNVNFSSTVKGVNRGYLRGATMGAGSGCDTINVPDTTWGGTLITFVDSTGSSGYISGTNSYQDVGKAQYYDASATTDNYLIKTWIAFGVASTKDVTKVVPVNVYDGTGGSVGTLLATSNLTMQTIISDVAGQYYTEVVFNPPIRLPASKQFFIGVDLSNLQWGAPHNDTLAIVSSDKNKASGAWEEINPSAGGGWYSFTNDYPFDVGLYMQAFLSPNQVCGDLPVHLTSFTAQTKGSDVLLNWQVAQETEMRQYDVQRAGSNLQFVTVGTVAAINSPLTHTYTFTDAGAAATAGDLFYRLKQVGKNGSLSYSNIIKVNSGSSALSIKVVNPFGNAVQLHINSPVAQKITAGIYDLLGRKVATLNQQLLAAGDNFVNMQTGTLPKGVYILSLSAGGTTYKYKIVTQ